MRGSPGQGWETAGEGLHRAEKRVTGVERETTVSEREAGGRRTRCKNRAEVVVDGGTTTGTEDLAIAPEN